MLVYTQDQVRHPPSWTDQFLDSSGCWTTACKPFLQSLCVSLSLSLSLSPPLSLYPQLTIETISPLELELQVFVSECWGLYSNPLSVRAILAANSRAISLAPDIWTQGQSLNLEFYNCYIGWSASPAILLHPLPQPWDHRCRPSSFHLIQMLRGTLLSSCLCHTLYRLSHLSIPRYRIFISGYTLAMMGIWFEMGWDVYSVLWI